MEEYKMYFSHGFDRLSCNIKMLKGFVDVNRKCILSDCVLKFLIPKLNESKSKAVSSWMDRIYLNPTAETRVKVTSFYFNTSFIPLQF